MPISSWVLTLLPEGADRTLEALAADPRITMGLPSRDRVPLVFETATPEEDAALCRRVQALPGASLALVAVDFSDVERFDRHAFGAAARPAHPTEDHP